MFETCNFSNMSWELLIWNFQMKLEKELLFEIFETCNFSNPSWAFAYLKLSDETWNEMCYLKFWYLKLLKPIMGSCLFETFRWDLKWDVLFETFETWNFAVWNYLKLLTCPLRTKKFQLTLNLGRINFLAHRVDICHSFICHSLTFIWMLSAVMFVFLTTLILMNIVSMVCFYQSLI